MTIIHPLIIFKEYKYKNDFLNFLLITISFRFCCCCLVSNSCLTVALPGSSVHGIFQARILEWGCYFLLQGIFSTQGSN